MLTKRLTALAIGLLVTDCAPMPGVETASAIVRPAVTAGVAHTFAVLRNRMARPHVGGSGAAPQRLGIPRRRSP